MSSSAIHRCQHCGYENEINSSLAVFAENPHCRQVRLLPVSHYEILIYAL